MFRLMPYSCFFSTIRPEPRGGGGRQPPVQRSARFSMKLTISPSKVAYGLTAVVMVLTLVGLAVRFIELAAGRRFAILMSFDPGGDVSVHTWYSTGALFFCALLLGVIGLHAVSRHDRFRWHWLVLGLIFAALSIDEVACIHERMGGHLANLMFGKTHGVFYFNWVIPGMAAVLLVGLPYLKFLAHLPRSTGRQIIIAAAIFVGGAIGVEMFNSQYVEVNGADNMTFMLGTAFEEFLEMIGIVIFLHALLSYLARDIFGQERLTLEIAGTPSEDAVVSTPPRRDQSATSPLPRPAAEMVLVKPR